MSIDLSSMYVVNSWAFPAKDDPREGLPNFHMAKGLSKLVEAGKLVLVEEDAKKRVFKDKRKRIFISYGAKRVFDGVTETIVVSAPGIAEEAIGLACSYSVKLQAQLAVGYTGRL